MNRLARTWKNLRRGRTVRRIVTADVEIEPDEIFLDSSNLPSLDPNQMEGRVERPVSRVAVIATGVVFLIVAAAFGYRAYDLQIVQGATYAAAAADNGLSQSLIFAERGVIYDRNGVELAWNEPKPVERNSSATSTASTTGASMPYAAREYAAMPGLGLLLGYIRYPKQDSSGNWWSTTLSGIAGIEQIYDAQLAGTNGSEIIEKDALGNVVRTHIEQPPVDGTDITLSIDAKVQSELFSVLSQHAQQYGFTGGGAAAIMDVQTGKIIALTSFPEYDSQVMTDGDPAAIAHYNAESQSPYLFTAVAGAYTPGSIVKPFLAAAALDLGIISPDKQIYSDGSMSVANPYDPSHPYVYHDWRYQGEVDMRHAIAWSSDVYFYEVGGGYGDQQGLGIDNIDKFMRMFGFGSTTGSIFSNEVPGTLSSPAWKAATFDNAPWRIGDTYISAIGQYGTQVTALQVVRAYAALANGGTLYTPEILENQPPQGTKIDIPDADLEVAREGMRLAVTDPLGTDGTMNVAGIQLAGKTGTAQLGAHNEWMNSWAVGFWPYDHPKYVIAAVLAHAPAGTESGAAPGLIPFFQWLVKNEPQYVK